MSCTCDESLTKHPSYPRVLYMDFSGSPEIDIGGQTLASATAADTLKSGGGSDTLTIGAVTVSGTKAQATFTGGTAEQVYTILWVGTTSTGEKLPCCAELKIEAC